MKNINAVEISQFICTHKIVAIIRGKYSVQGVRAIARGLLKGGVKIIEVTANSPGCFDFIRLLVSEFGEELLVAGGTVLDTATVKEVTFAGARVIVAPNLDVAVVRATLEAGAYPIPGVATPTEAVSALRCGVRMVKLFPASHFGPSYVRAIMAPLNNLQIMVTGGVNADNVRSFLEAGAVAAGIGGNLVPPETGDLVGLEELVALEANRAIGAAQ